MYVCMYVCIIPIFNLLSVDRRDLHAYINVDTIEINTYTNLYTYTCIYVFINVTHIQSIQC
jgi:hypothetical protein